MPALLFAQPCTVNDARGCVCEDGSTDCYLLPNIKLSYDLLVDAAENPETPGLLRVSVSTPNVGHGPLRVIATNDLVCGVDTFFNSSITVCPDGSDPSQLVKQRVYRKQGDNMTYQDRWAGTMTYHPTHAHAHFDDWGVYSLRIPDPNEPNPLNWTMVGEGAKLGFCLMDYGTCEYYNGHCRDDNDNILTTNLPNYGLGGGTYSCGVTNQGISVGWTDVYYYYLDGMFITIPAGVCNGDYALVVQVDPHDVLLEENENDNLMVAPITLTQQTNCVCASLDLDIRFDGFPTQTNWEITDANGTVVASGDGSGSIGNANVIENTCLPDGCYDLTFYDTVGNGMCPFQSAANSSGTFITPGTLISSGSVVASLGSVVTPGLCGSYSLYDATGNLIVSGGGGFGASQSNNFCMVNGVPQRIMPDTEGLGYDNKRMANTSLLNVYPTLASDRLTIHYNSSEDIEINVIDINGKILQQYSRDKHAASITTLNISNIPTGIYFIQIMTANGVVMTEKFVKQ